MTFKFDAYPVGDRLLEGIMFKVEVDEIALKVLSVAPLRKSDADYMNKLNLNHWTKQITDYLNEELNNSFDQAAQQDANYAYEFIDFVADFGLDKI